MEYKHKICECEHTHPLSSLYFPSSSDISNVDGRVQREQVKVLTHMLGTELCDLYGSFLT